MRHIAFSVAALLACACQPEAAKPAEPATAETAQPATLPNGATLSYIRSNRDGTLPEHINVHIVSPTEVHVTKMVSPCTDAAYVTATFDPATQEATRLVGGRLQKDGTQLPQAWLTLTPERRLEVRIGDPASAPDETHLAPPAPWRIYDFDLAEFALFGPRKAENFTFGVALAWPDGSEPLLRVLGPATARYDGSPLKEVGTGKPMLNSFELGGAAFADGGELWTEPAYGYVIHAAIPRPNHTGYKDFKIELQSAAIENGDETWKQAIAAHWQGC
jgi:hypothetical protein